jgi:hypothetical protein
MKGRWNKPKNKMKKHLFSNLSPRIELINKRERQRRRKRETDTQIRPERKGERVRGDREGERDTHA